MNKPNCDVSKICSGAKQFGVLHVAACVLAFIGLIPIASAHAARPGFESLDLVVDQPIWEDICTMLALSDEQRAAAQPKFEEYFAAVKALDAQIKQRQADGGLKRIAELQQAEAAFRQQHGNTPADIEAIEKYHEQFTRDFDEQRAIVLGEAVNGNRQADVILNSWMEELRASLPTEQQAKFDAVLQHVRRVNVLPPDSSTRDFRQVDFLAIVDQATAPEMELSTLAPADISRIVEEFKSRLDLLIVQMLAEQRKMPERDFRSTISANDEENARRIAVALKPWGDHFDLVQEMVLSISRMLEHAGKTEQRDAWLRRYQTELCPKLTGYRWPDDLTAWLADQPGATEEQLSLARSLDDQYQRKRQLLVEAAIAAGARAKRKYAFTWGSHNEQITFEKILIRLEDLHFDTIAELRGFLAPEQAKKLDADVAEAMKGYVDEFRELADDRNAIMKLLDREDRFPPIRGHMSNGQFVED